MPKQINSFKNHYVPLLKETWKSSKSFRTVLVLALVWFSLRMVMQFALAFMPVGDQIGADLATYLRAGNQFISQQDLYLQGSLEVLEEYFQYSPIFAFVFVPFTWLPGQVVTILHLLLHILIYWLLFQRWGMIFKKFGLEKASRALVLSIPLWLLFSAFWDDLTYLNIYTLITLVGTLLIETVVNEKLTASAIWLAVILAIKPHWAFAAALPLLLGRYRFFLKMILAALGIYLCLVLLSILASSPAYILEQYREYAHFLSRLSRDFPWRGPERGFLGYNHSIVQIFVFLAGVTALNMKLATAVKLVLLVPAIVISVRNLVRPTHRAGHEDPHLSLQLAFLLYLAAFIWLDMVWELFLGIVIYAYLMSSLKQKRQSILVLVTFIPYALLDLWRIICYLSGAPLIDEAYLAWDFSMYFPIIMVVILLFYGLLAARLWLGKDTDSRRAPENAA